eukprot:UN12012
MQLFPLLLLLHIRIYSSFLYNNYMRTMMVLFKTKARIKGQ